MVERPLRQRALTYAALLGALQLFLHARSKARHNDMASAGRQVTKVTAERRPLPVGEIGTVVLKYVAIAAAAGALILVMKALVMTGLDPEAAAALVANASPSTAVQMLLVVSPSLGFVLSLICAYQAGKISKPNSAELYTHGPQYVVTLVFLFAALMAPMVLQFHLWWDALLPLVVGAYAFFSGRSKRGWGYSTVISSLTVLIVIQFVYTPSMWLPKERVKITGTEYLVYITSESDVDLNAYFPENKAVLRLKKSVVEERQYCGDIKAAVTLGSAWRGSPDLPACPSEGKPFKADK
ncbi:hypothetical protein MOD31_11005 [Paenarthrobacter sp. TYUT067]|uniref:hypothetical protein n=1 Tax=Paenarthrobacter sp. TYUT067 TaxID=2926245 RepID=UPI00202EB3B6|nr:hypothetical protein [Paenarthrobacter sp. TYUT067]MCM0616553.1 hypothetical protein [Paenarthrobacter sp. TYUT067]